MTARTKALDVSKAQGTRTDIILRDTAVPKLETPKQQVESQSNAELATISKLQTAITAVREVKELDEIKLIIDQSEALKGYVKAQNMSQEIQDGAAEYLLYAKRQMGIISAGLEKATKGNQYTGKMVLPESGSTKNKTDTLKDAGIDIRRANEAEKLAAMPEEQFAEIVEKKKEQGKLTTNAIITDVDREAKAIKRESERKKNAVKVSELADPLEAQGLFQTIVIDPPWDWGDEGDINQLGRAKPNYSTMPIEDIEALPINKISDDNCHLYLWVTNRSLPKAFRLIELWGFRYITCVTWIKPSFGMGNYFRGSTEQILFAVKGSQPLKRKDYGTHFEAQRGKGHSAKPDEFYKMVQSCSYDPYIDIFGRKNRDGWTVWGENSDT